MDNFKRNLASEDLDHNETFKKLKSTEKSDTVEYPKGFWETEESNSCKPLNFNFTSTARHVDYGDKTNENTFDGNPLFWSTGDIKTISRSVMVKVAYGTVHIRANRKVFKYPLKELDILIAAMEKCLMSVSKNEDGESIFAGLTEVSTYEDQLKLDFFNSPHCIRVYYLRLCPYIGERYLHGKVGLNFRIMEEVSNDKYKIYKNGKLLWAGRNTSISLEEFKGLLDIFKHLQPELTVDGKL